MYLIGITGGTGCGKSTIVDKIINEISEKDICVLSQDSYYKDNSNLSFEQRDKLNYDIPEALENNYNFPLRCSFRPLFSKPILPNISSVEGGNASDIIKKDSLNGLNEKFKKFFDLKTEKIERNKKYLIYKDSKVDE